SNGSESPAELDYQFGLILVALGALSSLFPGASVRHKRSRRTLLQGPALRNSCAKPCRLTTLFAQCKTLKRRFTSGTSDPHGSSATITLFFCSCSSRASAAMSPVDEEVGSVELSSSNKVLVQGHRI